MDKIWLERYKVELASWKSEAGRLDIYKLETTPVDLSKLDN